MITLTLIALLIFVPCARGILGGFVSGISRFWVWRFSSQESRVVAVGVSDFGSC